MWNVVKMTGLIHNIGGRDSVEWPSALEVLDALWEVEPRRSCALATSARSARVASRHRMLDLSSGTFTPLNDVRGQLVYCESGTSVVLTMVDGKIVYENAR